MMGKIALCFALSLAFLSGCAPRFDNLIVPTAKEKVEISPYLGTWKLTEMFGGKPGEDVFISVRKEGDGLRIIVAKDRSFSRNSVQPTSDFVKLTRSHANVLAFAKSRNSGWHVFKLLLTKNNKELEILSLDQKKLEEEVNKGVLKGQIVNGIENDKDIHISASVQDLRKYLAKRALFEKALVLTRSP